jgi:N-acetylmuramoyl-L-alanine amidase
VPGYLELRDQIGEFDFSPLAGRRIVIDPGHGGFFRGAIGLSGLTEAEVNLGVALYLRGLLEWAGAEVHLTRTADYDFLAPTDSSLASDLAARIALVDSVQPDVFLSIHHNSNASLDRDLNETQTYYPVGREGADLDLARSIHKYLVRNLQIDPAKIMAGNFYVLRNSQVPAVLGEPSMISNPIIEKRLSLAAKQELEAKAYFLGLLEYFAAGMPRWVCMHGDTVSAADIGWQPLTWHFEPGRTQDPALDPATIDFTVDGMRQVPVLSPDGCTLSWLPPPELAADSHRIELVARNLRGRATPICQTWWINPAERGFDTYLWFESGMRKALCIYESQDAPLASYNSLRLAWRTEQGFRERVAPIYPGRRGWILLENTDSVEHLHFSWTSSAQTRGQAQSTPLRWALNPGWRWQMLHARDPAWAEIVVPGGAWRLRWLPGLVELSRQRQVMDPTSPAVPLRRGAPCWLEADGAHPIFADATGREPWTGSDIAQPDTFHWRPVAPELRRNS